MSKSNQNTSTYLLEKTLSSVEVFIGKFLRVQRDQVELSNGQISYREYIKHPGAAMVIPLLDDGSVVMVRQYRHAMKQAFLEFPAGKIDKGEEPLQAAHRELKEETGYSCGEMIWLTTIHPVIGYADERIEIYLAKSLTQGQQNLDAGEYVEIETHQPQELLEMIRKNQMTDVKTQIGVFWLSRLLNNEWT